MLPHRFTAGCTQQARRSRQNTSRMRPTVVLLAFVCLFSTNALLSHQRALAAASDLDPSFDTDGKQTTDFFGGVDQAQSVALQTDGKIVVAGQATQGSNTLFALARYNPDGSLDTGFGAGGKVTTSFGSGDSAAYGVAIQPDGKIVAVGGSTGDFAVARYNPDGSPDNSFDVDGKVTIDLRGGSDFAQAVVIQPDGKIVIAGGTLLSGRLQFALVRLNPDGSLDDGFGESGMALTAFVGSAAAHAVTLQPDGKIVVGGEAAADFALARYNPDGSLDTSFYLGGKTVITFPGVVPGRTDSATSVIIQPDGKIIAGGSVQFTNNTRAIGLARFNSDGSLDNSFDGDGRTLVLDFNPSFTQQQAVLAQQPDGKILAAATGSSSDFALARFNLDGSLDQTFGNGGKMTTDFGGTQDLARGMALQSDGKFVVVGLVNGNFGIARYQGDTPTPPVCLYGVTPARQVVPVVGGAGTFEVNAPNGCAWNAVSNAPSWLSITSPASGAGNGQISYTAAAHSGLLVRTGTITVAGQTFTVAQGGPKVAVFVVGTTSTELEAARTNLSGTGLFAQVDAFLLTREFAPALSDLQRYNAVLYFGENTFQVFPTDSALVGNALADYVDAGGGVVIGNLSWSRLQGRIATSTYSPYNTPAPYGDGGQLVKLQPRHPILAEVLSLAPTDSIFNLTLTAGAERIANWASGTPAVATKQPTAGRVVGLNLYPPYGNDTGKVIMTGLDGPRLFANSMLWAANTNRAISGRIIDAAGHGVPGLFPTLNDELTTLTDADGNYVFFPRAGGNYTVKPGGSNLVFSPASHTFTNLTSDQTADFTLLSVMQFNTNALAFNESDGGASVVITRTGDLSQSTTVNYSTVDNTADVGCADTTTLPGVAFARCDYATSLDTITFAPGESQKTITVPLINDAYVEPDQTFQLVLSNPSAGALLGARSTLVITLHDDDVPDAPNPVFTTPFLVRQLYLDFLNREPEQGEPWSNVLNNCPDVNNLDPASPSASCDRITVAGSFFGAPEFRLKGLYVLNFYQVAFNGRLPAYAEIILDMRAVTGQTSAEVFQKRAQFAVAFTQRDEFRALYDGLSNAAYVSALLSRYGVTTITSPDPAAPDGNQFVTLTQTELSNQLTAGTLTRARVLRAVVESREVGEREFNRAFVAMQYYGYLRRTPETSGFNSWLTYLNAHPTEYRTLTNGFLNSTEYRLRFGRPTP
jgi:uncharacterized delta-60 repeat protein